MGQTDQEKQAEVDAKAREQAQDDADQAAADAAKGTPAAPGTVTANAEGDTKVAKG